MSCPVLRVVLSATLLSSLFAVSPIAAHEGLEAQISKLGEAISEAPDDPRLRLRLAELHRQHGEYARAWSELSQARALGADDNAPSDTPVAGVSGPSTGLVRARLLADQGWPGAARRAVEQHLVAHPDDGSALVFEAGLLAAAGQPRAAARCYERALAAGPEASPDLYLAAAAQLAGPANDPAAALALLERGLQTMANQPALLRAALQIERTTGRLEPALARLEHLAEATPRPEAWLALRGDLLAGAGRHDDARQAWLAARAALQRVPARRRGSAASRELAETIDQRLQIPPPRSSADDPAPEGKP